MDNARIHHAKIVKEFAEAENIKIIYNTPYDPKRNPIENVFSVVKKNVRKHMIENNSVSNLKKGIKEEFNNVDQQIIKNCYNNSFSFDNI